MKTRTRSIIGGFVTFVGLFVAVCTVDGSKNETRNRLIGVAMCAAGTAVLTTGDKGEEHEEHEERKTDHEPYPEE